MARSITFEEAVTRAIRSFYDGSSFESYEKTTKAPLKYNLDMFDEIQNSYKRKNKRNKKKSESGKDFDESVDDLMEDDENGD